LGHFSKYHRLQAQVAEGAAMSGLLQNCWWLLLEGSTVAYRSTTDSQSENWIDCTSYLQ
jgi:hypothetical protein